jgi:hypothetical protein
MRGVTVSWLIVLPALAACAPGPQPCNTPGTCARGYECLANRCVAAGGAPVPAGSRRIVTEAARMAVVSSRAHPRAGELPTAVVFGSRAEGSVGLYLDFEPAWPKGRRIESAFVLLDPMPGTPVGSRDVRVDAWRVKGAWDEQSLTWLRQPPLGRPHSQGIARSAPPSVLRIDVTALARAVHDGTRSYHGIALRSRDIGSVGASFSTGIGGGQAPRLEIYYR